ncbi:MAG: M13 family metallopeptidase [Xanthomonadales bacterium]|nr:M13 family metallopeptidase [Xanthomonadales bacterium]NNL95172.1 M13 family metallopeptidase [Xanthomonadales bacterium]
MKKWIAIAAATSLVAACGQGNNPEVTSAATATQAAPEVEEVHSGVLVDNMDTAIRPGDDFNVFVNGGWMASAEIPADRASNTVGLQVHEEATENVRKIIEESAEGDFAKGTDEQKVGDLYVSYMDMDTRNTLGVTPLQQEFNNINALEDYTDLAVYFAEVNKLGVGTPFVLGQYVDFKDPNTYMMYTFQAGLGLPDREYYFDDSERGLDIRNKYVAHVEKMFDLAGLEGGADAAQTIMALETRLAEKHMLKEETRNMVALYNKIPLDELPGLMPDFAWDEYLEAAQVSTIDGLVVTQLDYTRALNDIITSTPIETWKTYLHWKVLNTAAGLLNEELDNQNFAFYSNTLNGIEQQLPMWKRAVGLVNANLGEVVGKVYVSRHFPPQAKDRMMELVDNLILAYEQSINELDWMGEETRAQALDKLSKFTPKIGYPDEWKDYSRLDIEPDDLVGNMKRSALFNYEENIKRQGGPVDRGEWQMTPQTVNAYYNPPLNEIVFPAAILQPPYFDLNADDAVNYGSIGAVIGHEIGHGFDDSGSTFDGDGVLRNWWTDEDRAEFEARTAKLVEQYSQFRPFEDLAVNGEFTLGENIGDLGGLAIALKAYHLSLDGQEAPVMDGFTGDQRVFIGYAQGWRGIQREEALRQQIATDPHSPRQYRVNGVVRNIPEFYEAFDVSEDDALYLPPGERVKIW